MQDLVFRADSAFLMEIWKLSDDEMLLRCPVCNARVIFAPTWERARRHGVHPGAYCTKDEKHLMMMFELDPEIPEKGGRDT